MKFYLVDALLIIPGLSAVTALFMAFRYLWFDIAIEPDKLFTVVLLTVITGFAFGLPSGIIRDL